MLKLFTNANIFYDSKFVKRDFIIDQSGNFKFHTNNNLEYDEIIDCSGLHVFPGLIDTHVHLREPGFSYKDTIKTGSYSAAKGGFTHIFAMPNLNPVPDSTANLKVEQDLIKENAAIHVMPVCSITKGQKGQGELSDIDELSLENNLFSDDGKGVQKSYLMKDAMQKVSSNNGYILAHCEDENELKGGSLNEGPISKKFNDAGINNASEYNQVIRDIKLSQETNCNYHVCHVSTKESVDALRHALSSTNNISAEVTCHHLFLNENDIDEDNGKWKMNPPLRSKKDQQALINALLDGTIKMICTDNAPHSKKEKDCPIKNSLMGIVSIEIAFSLVYTNLVKKNLITLKKALDLMSKNAAKVFNLDAGKIAENKAANLCIFDLNETFNVDSNNFASLGKSCPFDGQKLYAKCKMTICDGKIVFRENI